MDLDWIFGPGYSLGRVHSGEISKNVTNFVTNAGSQLTWEGGRAGISKNVTNFVTDAGSQLTWEGGRAGISKNVTNFVTHAGSQLTFYMFRLHLDKKAWPGMILKKSPFSG